VTRSPTTRHQHGFTLLEMMAAVAVAAILVGVGVPSYQRFIAAQRVKTAVSTLNYTLLFARSEAIKRNAVVEVTPVGDCWQDGWEVRADGAVLARESGYPDLMIATAEDPGPSLSYNAEGRIEGDATPFQISSRGSDEVAQRCISLDLSGLPSVRTAACRTTVASCT